MSERIRPSAKELFLAALGHASAQQAGLLEQACGSDVDLRAAVEDLLRAHQDAGEFLESPPVDLAGGGRDGHEQNRPSIPVARAGVTKGTTIGPYKIIDEIGRGGVGIIYKVRDEEFGRVLAVKVLHAWHVGDAAMTKRFIEEAQITGQLQHPGIVPVHTMGRTECGQPYFSMKLVKGQTLAALLEKRKELARDRHRFLRIVEQVCQTLAYTHSRGVIHRDLKPSNIMVGAFGEVQVMDWGLAKLISREETKELLPSDVRTTIATIRSRSSADDSRTGSIMGTPSYMPPEQARGQVGGLDERADVFGLGALLCEVLTGVPPYGGETCEEICDKAKRGQLDEAVRLLNRCGADPRIVDLTKRCLSFQAAARPRDAAEVAKELGEYLATPERRDGASQGEGATAGGKTRRWWWPALTRAAAL